jgi:sorbose reductase
MIPQVSGTVDIVIKEFGRPDVMIANAGKPSRAAGLDDKLEDWHLVVDIDFNGAFYCARAAGEIFRKKGSGNMILA